LQGGEILSLQTGLRKSTGKKVVELAWQQECKKKWDEAGLYIRAT